MSYQNDIAGSATVYTPADTVLRDYLLWLILQQGGGSSSSITALLAFYQNGFNTGGFQSDVDKSIGNDNMAYSDGDCIGGLYSLDNAMRAQNKSGVLQSLMFRNNGVETPDLALLFFNDEPTDGTYTDHTAVSVSGADILRLSHTISITSTDYIVVGGITVLSASGLSKLITSYDSAGAIYLVIQAKAAVTFASANSLTISAQFLQNA